MFSMQYTHWEFSAITMLSDGYLNVVVLYKDQLSPTKLRDALHHGERATNK